MIDSEKNKLTQHFKSIYKNDIDILHFDGELDQFLAFLREGKEKFYDAISIYQAANETSSTFPNTVWAYLKKCLSLYPMHQVKGLFLR